MPIEYKRTIESITIVPNIVDLNEAYALDFASLFREMVEPHLDKWPTEVVLSLKLDDRYLGPEGQRGSSAEYHLSVTDVRGVIPISFPPSLPATRTGPPPVPQPQTPPVEELDARGERWNPELHAASKGKNQDGTWRKKDGIKSKYKKRLLEQNGLITVEETCSMMGVRHHMQLTYMRYKNPLFPIPQYIEGYAGYKREDILSYIELTKDEDSPPRFKCETDEYGCWYFECPHCHDRHTHGAGAGHRSAHCDVLSGSPFLESGYYITKE